MNLVWSLKSLKDLLQSLKHSRGKIYCKHQWHEHFLFGSLDNDWAYNYKQPPHQKNPQKK